MNNKMIPITIGATITLIVLATVLMPVIDDVATPTVRENNPDYAPYSKLSPGDVYAYDGSHYALNGVEVTRTIDSEGSVIYENPVKGQNILFASGSSAYMNVDLSKSTYGDTTYQHHYDMDSWTLTYNEDLTATLTCVWGATVQTFGIIPNEWIFVATDSGEYGQLRNSIGGDIYYTDVNDIYSCTPAPGMMISAKGYKVTTGDIDSNWTLHIDTTREGGFDVLNFSTNLEDYWFTDGDTTQECRVLLYPVEVQYTAAGQASGLVLAIPIIVLVAILFSVVSVFIKRQ